MEKKIVKAKSLDEYLKFIEEFSKYGEYYYRGEPDSYPKITSGITRVSASRTGSISSDLNRRLEAYYSSIAYSSDETIKRNFIPFSQHYGIKTNLIDITESPVAALYFACGDIAYQEKQAIKKEILSKHSIKTNNRRPRVHLFRTYDCIDMTDVITNTVNAENGKFYIGINDIFEENFLKRMLRYSLDDYLHKTLENINKIVKLSNLHDSHKNEHLREQALLNLSFIRRIYNVYNENTFCGNPTTPDRYEEVLDDLEKIIPEYRGFLEQTYYWNSILTGPSQYFKKVVNDENELASNRVYLLLLYNALHYFKSPDYLPELPIFTYKTISFDRIQRQRGLFIYQMLFEFIWEESSGQNIQSHYEIEIDSDYTDAILYSLDKYLDINERTLKGDLDSIAKYINRRYEPSN